MSDHEYPPDVADETPFRHFAGSVDRPKPLLEITVPHAWDAVVRVTELDLPGMGKRFEVRVTRMGGPKLPGTPNPIGVTVAQVDDVVAERDGERAREIAMRAADELRVGVIPDLQRLSETVRGGRSRAGDL